MATEAQVEANRANAQKSTGPRTPEGRETASQNALKHGLFARETVIRGEDEDEFEMFRLQLLQQLTPDSPLEEVLGERVVDLSWRLKRAAKDQSEAFAALYEKYVTEHPEPQAPSGSGTSPGVAGASARGAEGVPPSNRGPEALAPRGQACPEPCERDARDTDTAAAPPGMIGRMILEDFSHNGVLERLLRYERRIENSLLRTLKEMRGVFDQRQKAAQETANTLARWKEEDWEAKKARMFAPRPPVAVSPGPAGGMTNIPRAEVSRLDPIPSWRDAGAAQEGLPKDEPCKTNPISEGVSSLERQAVSESCKTNPISGEVSSVKCPVLSGESALGTSNSKLGT